MTPAKRLAFRDRVRLQLMLRRRWAYLRYLHLRQGLLNTAGVGSLLSVGCGTGIAEVLLALEFPEIDFHVTDVGDERAIEQRLGARMVREWSVDNASFGSLDVLAPCSRRYDMVTSVEVLEHIEHDDVAATRMLEAAKKYVFALVPFATPAMNEDPRRRRSVWQRQQHYRVGYDEAGLQALFPRSLVVRGCYWDDQGVLFRQRLDDCSDDRIRDCVEELSAAAKSDLLAAPPGPAGGCRGIWTLAAGATSG